MTTIIYLLAGAALGIPVGAILMLFISLKLTDSEIGVFRTRKRDFPMN